MMAASPPTGQPFFVMELVKGVPLTDYCDTKRLTVEARLQLFVAVCNAVQHAHQKGIIHRDLKPGNVLVTEVDGRPTPKVIDFGVAKATEQQLTDISFSDTGAIVRTPAYMSPEQADPSSMDIDTRSDVYALGVILYELLTGSPPIDAKQFKRGALLEMLRMVREVEAPRSSTKLSTAEALPNIAANRSIEPAKLAKLLRGELDWIVLKALEKERTRRYDTANGLARDVQRYLTDEVVEARPPSWGYRLKKFVKRNKSAVLAATIIILAILGGLAGVVVVQSKANRAMAAKNAELADEKAKVDAANRDLEKANHEIAAEKVKVEKRFELAQQAIRTYHTGVSEEAVLAEPELVELRKRLLSGAATFYTELQQLLDKETDRNSRQMLANGYFDLGTLLNSLGDSALSMSVHRKSLELRRSLAEDTEATESDRVREIKFIRAGL
jgi:eukaryotic-like serine/threonine-protein kinase